MDRPSARDDPGPGDPLRESRCLTVLRVPCDAQQALVEPLRIRGHARISH